MEEINLKDMSKYFVSKIGIIIAFTLIFLLFGALYTAIIQKPMYKSYTTILLTKESGSITNNDINLNNNLVDDYRELIKSKKIAKQVIKNLNLSYSPEKLISKIQVESVNDTNLLKIIITDKNSYVARDIANEIADVFVNKEVEYYYNIKNIGVVDKAEASKTPYNINIVKQIILSILIGFILGCGTVFIIYYFDNTIKDKETVEEKLKLPVIGSIPQTGGSK